MVRLRLVCLTPRRPWDGVASEALLSAELSRQEYWSGAAMSSPGASSRPRDQTRVSPLAGGLFTTEPSGKL